MSSRRIAKLEQAILEQVSTSILFDLKDPRVRNVTVTRVEVSPDAQHARVFVSILGDEKTQALCLHGLKSARGFLQSKVAARIRTRYTPLLSFEIDPGVKTSIEVSRLLRDLLPREEAEESHEESAEQRPQSPPAEGPGNREATGDVTNPGETAGPAAEEDEKTSPRATAAPENTSASGRIETVPLPATAPPAASRPAEKHPPDS